MGIWRACAGVVLGVWLVGGCATVVETDVDVDVDVDVGDGEGVGAIAEMVRPAVRTRSTSGSIRVAVRRLGTIGFDGQSLPVVSPDGRWIATTVGEARDWGVLTGESVGAGLVESWVEIWRADGLGDGAVWRSGAGEGLVVVGSLEEGVVVERVGAGGSRALEVVSWDGTGVRVMEEGEADERGVGRFRVGRGYSLVDSGGEIAIEVAGSDVLGVGVRADALTMYQMWITGSSGAVGGSAGEGIGMLVFDPGQGRMVLIDGGGGATGLLEGSYSASFLFDGGWGVLVAGEEGLLFQRLMRRAGGWEAMSATRVLDGPFFVRATGDASRPVIAFAPTGVLGMELMVLGLSLPGEG